MSEGKICFHQNKCCLSMCHNNATCLVGFTDKGYKCVCQAGYKGEHCEKGEDHYALHQAYLLFHVCVLYISLSFVA